MDTDPTSAEDTPNEGSDLTDRDTEDEEVLDEQRVTGEEEEEEEGSDINRPNYCRDGQDGARTVRPVQACQ